MLRDHREAIFRNFNEAAPEEKRLTTREDHETALCRAIRWERGEGEKPWWVVLQIDTVIEEERDEPEEEDENE